MNDNDSFRIGIGPVNPNTEEEPAGSNFYLTKLRLWEVHDPEYYVEDDKPLIDLRERDKQIADKMMKNQGGWYHEHFTVNKGLIADSVIPFTVSATTPIQIQIADFPTAANSMGWIQASLPRNFDITKDLNLHIHYEMSTGAAADVKIDAIAYYYNKGVDPLATPGTTVPITSTFTTIVGPAYDVETLVFASFAAATFDYVAISIMRDTTIGTNHPGSMFVTGVTLDQNKDV